MTKAFALLSLLAVGGAASAATNQADDQIKMLGDQAKKACASDIKKYCSKLTPGGGRILTCLSNNVDKISGQCNQAAGELTAAVQSRVETLVSQFHGACGKDLAKYCGRVPAGQGRLLSCLSGREDDLDKTCKDFLNTASNQVDELMTVQK
jgi:hypothetical protein